MIVDLHNHTVRCNHATGTLEAYVERAIENNTKYFGFSDHAPMSFDPEYRMGKDEMDLYEADVKRVKDMYKENITVLLAYEVDYLPGYIDDDVLHTKVDYLIGSVHFLDEWGFDNPEYIRDYKSKDIDLIWQDYFDAVENMAKTGLFDIVGHLDLIKVFNFLPKKDVRLIARNALQAIKKADMAVELNMAGYRKPVKEAYPSNMLLEVIRELDIPITFGSDAHAPKQVGLYSDELLALAKSHGFERCALYQERNRELIKF